MSNDGARRHIDQTRIMLRPIGSGLPLGEQKDVGMMLMSFVFPLELVATIVVPRP